jgi:Fur family peroxide stress response transcriptional regulator
VSDTAGLFKTHYYLIIDVNMSNASSDASIIEALRKKGYKATSQRIAICRFALRSRDHPGAQSIYSEVKSVHPTVSLATVYKTLQVLRELRLVQELAFAEGETRFDSYMEPHANLVCRGCGNISDVDDPVTQELITRVAARARFTLAGQRLDIYGLCEKCGSRAKLGSVRSRIRKGRSGS